MVGVVLLIQFILQAVAWLTILQFVIGIVFLLIGLPMFLVGLDMSVEKMVDLFSHYLIEHPKKVIVMIGIFGLGFSSSIAEQITQAGDNFVPTTDSITDGFDMIAIVSLMLIVIVHLVGIFYNYQVKQK